jgi:ADP-ribosylglycohydrolase
LIGIEALKLLRKLLSWAINKGGDRDTTCAIVGGIVALKVGFEGIPQSWIENRESLTNWQECEVNWD